jgi:hypothetical protein
MKPVEIIPGMGEGRMKEGHFNYDTLYTSQCTPNTIKKNPQGTDNTFVLKEGMFNL